MIKLIKFLWQFFFGEKINCCESCIHRFATGNDSICYTCSNYNEYQAEYDVVINNGEGYDKE